MDRRLAGAAILLVAVLGVGVLSVLNGSRTAGYPVAEAVPAPPAIGDCVTGDVDAIAGWRDPPTRDVDLTVAQCSGSRDAEVVAVIDDVAAVSRDSADWTDGVGFFQDCYPPALDYVGVGDASSTEYGDWSPAAWVGVGLVGPNRRQVADGQTWAACVVFASIPGETPAADLTGSVRDVVGRLTPDTVRFASCLERATGAAMSCTRPHRVEVFAEMTFHLPSPEPTALLRSCRDVVTAQTLMPDPTAAGALTIAANIDPTGELTFPDGTPGKLARCTVTSTDPTRALASTLRQLGTPPLPLN